VLQHILHYQQGFSSGATLNPADGYLTAKVTARLPHIQ